jgi:hypothetical protein
MARYSRRARSAARIHRPVIPRLAQLSCCQPRPSPHVLLISTSTISAPMPFEKRSTVTSTNGFTCCFRSFGSGRNRISRVVLSIV